MWKQIVSMCSNKAKLNKNVDLTHTNIASKADVLSLPLVTQFIPPPRGGGALDQLRCLEVSTKSDNKPESPWTHEHSFRTINKKRKW